VLSLFDDAKLYKPFEVSFFVILRLNRS